MGFSSISSAGDDGHPIDLAEHMALSNDWDFDRIAEDQIAMALEGAWRVYSLTLAWSAGDEMLRLICTYEMEPPAHRLPEVHDLLNRVNDDCWTGAFTWWDEQKLMVYRYGLLLAGDQMAGPDQIGRMIHSAITACERYYPAFQLATWGGESAEAAMRVAISEAWGRA
ncbi:MAG: YbjN domain-containing protein [Rubellimicrobium sp.]|nr:YbjN domain-containing protein [Rubellimicrobium sp.]